MTCASGGALKAARAAGTVIDPAPSARATIGRPVRTYRPRPFDFIARLLGTVKGPERKRRSTRAEAFLSSCPWRRWPRSPTGCSSDSASARRRRIRKATHARTKRCPEAQVGSTAKHSDLVGRGHRHDRTRELPRHAHTDPRDKVRTRILGRDRDRRIARHADARPRLAPGLGRGTCVARLGAFGRRLYAGYSAFDRHAVDN